MDCILELIETQAICTICNVFYNLSPTTNQKLKCVVDSTLSRNKMTRNLLILRYFKTQRNFKNQCVKLSADTQYREPSSKRVYYCQQIHSTENHQLHVCTIVSRYTVQRTISYTCVKLSADTQYREPSSKRVYYCQQIHSTENHQLHVCTIVST